MKGSNIMKKGFTLAEVLITLAIIGVVAALTIPSVILNTNQTEYKSALKKAVSVLNQAVSLKLALDNESPSEAGTPSAFMSMIQNQMNTVATYGTCAANGDTVTEGAAYTATDKCAFTTTDGMQFILATQASMAAAGSAVFENSAGVMTAQAIPTNTGSACTNKTPCYLMVDVNGTRNPNQMTTSAASPKDRFVLQFAGDNGTTISPVGFGGEVMYSK